MKKILFLSIALTTYQVSGQHTIPQTPKSLNEAAPCTKHQYVEYGPAQITQPVLPSTKKTVLAVTTVGETNYDLQSNACVGKRINYNASTGKIAAVWTGSTGTSPYSDRGAFYNFYDGTAWGAKPTGRIENLRTGWPTLVHTNISELVISHDFGTFNLILNKRATAGSGAWTQTTGLGNGALNPVWPRAATGGTNGNTVHVIAITAPVASGGTEYKGFNGALLYWRSTDGGTTWGIQDSIIPQIDTAQYSGFSADSYSIDAKGNTVAIGVFNDLEASFLLKSTDNGSTWTRTEFWTTGLQDYDPDASGSISDINNDGIADTLESTDNAGEVLIDNNGLVHVFFGRQRYLDDDPVVASNFSYFPVTNGLFYWNENSTSAQIITGALDLDNDGQLGISAATEIPRYFKSLSTFPSAGIDANNNIFLTYSALNELEFSGTQFFNKIYAINSRDGGATWTTPTELTKALPSLECVYGSLARTVTDKYRLIFQLDGEPGGIVQGDLDAPGVNDIIYLDVDTTGGIGIGEYQLGVNGIKGLYPNPASDMVALEAIITEADYYSIEITDVAGTVLKNIELGNVGTGRLSQTIELSDLKPGMYLISMNGVGRKSVKRLVIN